LTFSGQANKRLIFSYYHSRRSVCVGHRVLSPMPLAGPPAPVT
jgi:hypothetical protein